jgi:Na+-transporting NADH:ubiquinone oxidoreductase subunit NqrD
MLDGLGMGFGFTLALTMLGAVREVLGAGRSWEFTCSVRTSNPGCCSCCRRADSFRWPCGCCSSRRGESAAQNARGTRGGSDRNGGRGGGKGMNESLTHIFLDAFLINNFVLCVFLGMCSFLGLSAKFATAWRMGVSVMFVITVSDILSYGVNLLLVAVHAEYLRIICSS